MKGEKTMKYYAVKSGRTKGIFENWKACEESIKGFSGAEYKSFDTREEAEAYLNDIDIFQETIKNDIEEGYVVAFCDGSYDKDKNRYSYGVLIIDLDMNEHEICGSSKNEKYISSQNIIGEILGAINAMDWAVSNNYKKLKIYHDYEGIGKWPSGEWKVKSNVADMYVSIYMNKYIDLINVKFEKVKGHSNNKYNDKADELARRALYDNARVPIAGDHWFSVSYFKLEELKTIINLLSENHSMITVKKDEKANSLVYKLLLDDKKLSVTYFKTGKRKLLVQGANTILFQIFLTYVYELLGKNADSIFGDAYRKSIDSKMIDSLFQKICPAVFPQDYPENIKRFVRQAIINLKYYVESEDYSQYVFPALRALEGHMKYLFNKAGYIISKTGFTHFYQDKTTQHYCLKSNINVDAKLKSKLEEYYNYYKTIRHALFHYGDIAGATDSTMLIESKNDADEHIKKCLQYICEE